MTRAVNASGAWGVPAAKVADPSWDHNDLTDLAGAPEDYLPTDRLNAFFSNPGA